MRKHKLSLWSGNVPEKPLEPCRELSFSIDKSGQIPKLNVTQGKMITMVAMTGKGRSRYVQGN